MDPDTTDLARAMYEGYARHTGCKTFDGRPMPTFDELPDRIKNAWGAAGIAGARSLAQRLLEEIHEPAPATQVSG